MKKIFLPILLFIFTISCKCVNDNTITYTSKQLNDSIYKVCKDYEQKIQILKIQDSLRYTKIIDSIMFENNHYKQIIYEGGLQIDSLNEEVLNLKYKIERIKYYNNIAKNGNNIKFLRGWINRVINE